MLNYYAKCLPNQILSTTLAPLYSLLQKTKKWTWGELQKQSFQKAKESLTGSNILTHYDQQKELLFSCDASLTLWPRGSPVSSPQRWTYSFCKQITSPSRKKIHSVRQRSVSHHFWSEEINQYLLGRKFTILSDHRPLEHLLSEKNGTPSSASSRIKCWALILAAYDYKIQYKPGKDHVNADVLSRIPLLECPENIPPPGEMILLMDTLENTPVNVQQVKKWTDNNPILSTVRTKVQQDDRGPDDNPQMQTYIKRMNKLSIQDGCVMWGDRVVIPLAGRERVLKILHNGHPGILRMKSIAHGVVWWPKLTQLLRRLFKTVKLANCIRNHLHQHLYTLGNGRPARPWSRSTSTMQDLSWENFFSR